MRVRHVGTIDPYIAAAFAPDGHTLYVNHDGSGIVAYTYPGLVAGATVATPDGTGGAGQMLGTIACDGDGVLYWWDMTDGNGNRLYASTDPLVPFFIGDVQLPMGLCWSPFDGLLYSYGVFDILEDQTLCSLDASIPGGDRTIVLDPPDTASWGWINGPVPTPNGHIFFNWPHTVAAAARIRHWDPTGVNTSSTVNVVVGSLVPASNNLVYWYGDPSGPDPAAGYSLDLEHSLDDAPEFDIFTGGVRAAAYTPNFRVVAFEHGDTGEVWQLTTGSWATGGMGSLS